MGLALPCVAGRARSAVLSTRFVPRPVFVAPASDVVIACRRIGRAHAVHTLSACRVAVLIRAAGLLHRRTQAIRSTAPHLIARAKILIGRTDGALAWRTTGEGAKLPLITRVVVFPKTVRANQSLRGRLLRAGHL